MYYVFKCRNGVAPPYLIDSFNANTFKQEILPNLEYPFIVLNIIIEAFQYLYEMPGITYLIIYEIQYHLTVLNSISLSMF